MKKIISILMSVVMLITALDFSADASAYFSYSSGTIYTNEDFYDLMGMSRAGSTSVDLTATAKFENQGFARIIGSSSSVNFARYKFTLKKKDKVTFKIDTNQKFITDCVAIYIFNDDHEYFYENGFNRRSKTSETTFSDSITLSKGTYYLFFATNTTKNVDFDLTISAPKHKEKKPNFTLTAQSGGKVKIKWKKISGATKYRVYKFSNGKYKLLKTTKNTSYTVKNLVKGNKYSYLVTACVDGKWTSKSVTDVKDINAE